MTCLLLAAVVAAADFPPLPTTTADAADLGRGVQRTMTLLATSTKEKPNTVRILFYGQSITEQDWWKQVVADLKKRFPTAVVIADNRAIGGFGSQRLVLTAEHDLYHSNADLVIFHVYGAHDKYEEIIRTLRTRSAAEVLMQRDHLTKWPPAVLDEKADKGMWWDDQMNTKYLPAIAGKYGCGLVDVRGRWIDYLKAHKLEPKALLKDNIHLNDHGNFVMASVVSRHLVHRPELKEDQKLAREYVAGTNFKLQSQLLILDFEGSRVDVDCRLWASDKNRPTVAVTIDGKKPSEFPGCYAITRPSPGPWTKLFLMRIDHEKPLVAESWTLVVKSVEADKKKWVYTVTGSVTGPDGVGVSDARFTSRSGRVRIDPANWFPNGGPDEGAVIKWEVVPLSLDNFQLPTQSMTITLAQGLPNGKHTLRLTGYGLGHVQKVRVYKPPLPSNPEGK